MGSEPGRRDGTSFTQFRASLGNEVARGILGLPMSDADAARLLSSDEASRELYERWIAGAAGASPSQWRSAPSQPLLDGSIRQAPLPALEPRHAGPYQQLVPAPYYEGRPGYLQAPAGYAQAEPPLIRPTSSWAVAGFICALLWGLGVLSLVGVFVSAHAWRTETARGLKGGHGLAVAGVIIGAIGSLPLIARIVVYLAQLFSGA